MKKFLIIISFLLLLCSLQVYAQDPALEGLKAINRDVLNAQLGFLASDWMEGRRTGERGEKIASDYIASMLRLYGVRPFGDRLNSINLTGSPEFDERSYFQNFNIISRSRGGEAVLKIIEKNGQSSKATDLENNIDFIINAVSSAGTEAGVIFAGYGIRNSRLRIDELAGLNIKGKFIMRISSMPENLQISNDEFNLARREFESYIVKEGAAGIVEIYPYFQTNPDADTDFSPSEHIPQPQGTGTSYSLPWNETWGGLIRINITMSTANKLITTTGRRIEEYISKPEQRQLPDFQPGEDLSINLRTSIERRVLNVRNVVGIIEGKNTNEFVVLGAHYDHMGSNNGYIWNGADDNGSGTVGIMSIAKAIMETGIKPEKSIIIALWTAEEQGLHGSKYFLQMFDSPAEKIKLNLNMDMISRYISDDQKNKVVMTYTASNKEFRNITEDNLKKYDINLEVEFQPSDDPPGGTDHRNFSEIDIPVMRFKPGHREEYHTPYDETTTIDWDIMEKITKISFLNIFKIAVMTQ